MGSSKSPKRVTLGYHYHLNIHFTLGHSGIQELQEIRVGDRVAWKGLINGSGTALISQTKLFGGKKREGGLWGLVDFMTGEKTQPVNPSLKRCINDNFGQNDVPAYRGITSVFMKGLDGADLTGTPWESCGRGTLPVDENEYPATTTVGLLRETMGEKMRNNFSFYWSAMSPYFKLPTFKVKSIFDEWYPEKATIGANLNPAHIYYSVLTNHDWGLGHPTQDIDTENFTAAADQFFSEGLGISIRWENQSAIDEFLIIINEHCNCTLNEDRVTGKWRLTLVREDYDVNTLPVLDESNCTVESFSRKTLSDTINEVVVSYTILEDGSEDTVSAQDLANFANQGRINSQKRNYPGINDPDLAAKLAFRDLQSLSKPLAKVTIKTNRDAFNWYPGEVFKLNWPRHGISGAVFRIGEMDLGDLENGEITIEAIEDAFGLPQKVYTRPASIGWVDTSRSPESVAQYRIQELSYYELYTSTTSSDRMDWPVDVEFAAIFSKSPNADSSSLDLYDTVIEEVIAEGVFTPTFTLGQDCNRSDTTLYLNISIADDVFTLSQGGLCWLGTELIEVTSYNDSAASIIVKRGMIDTIPVNHIATSTLWFYRSSLATWDETIRVSGEAVSYKLLSESSKGQLSISEATTITRTLQTRLIKPYPPANVQVNGLLLPDVFQGEFNLSWSHRDRTQQVAGLIAFNQGSIGPETNVLYDLKVYDEEEVNVYNNVQLSADAYNYEVGVERDTLGKYVDSPTDIFQTSRTIVLPTSDVYLLGTNPIAVVFDGTRILFKTTAKNIATGSTYGVLCWMDPTTSVINFEDTSALFGAPHSFACNGTDVTYNVNGWFGSVPIATAYQAGKADWGSIQHNAFPVADTYGGFSFAPLQANGNTFFTASYHTKGIVLTSGDGRNYSEPGTTQPLPFFPNNIKFLNGKYVIGGTVLGYLGSPIITRHMVVSDDLVTFNERVFPLPFLNPTATDYRGGPTDTEYFSGNLIAIVNEYQGSAAAITFHRHIFRSVDDGINWIDITPDNDLTQGWIYCIVFNGLLVVFGEGKVATTSDLIAWTVTALSNSNATYTNPIIGGNAMVLATPEGPMKTIDGVTYTPLTINANVLITESSFAEKRLNSSLRFELSTIRDGEASMQKHNMTVDRDGYGYNFGKYYGGN